ncbi:amino acid adenylation domain-containing protein [Flavobacterium sp.]|uniref:amino acid adenylation domain-containing protein n=1 Tax=Flavobacterium sp. TaxID=239 RepID=UPI00286D3613|nr:amino acid adenylation domain-containing protein [Flavobacterium sp.]
MKINLIEYLKDTVIKFPNKTAIDDNHAQISFSELDVISNKIAAAIVSKNNSSRQPIAVYLSKNRWSILSFIGIFKSGNFYVPLDVKSPVDRVAKILDNLNAAFVITDSAHQEKLIGLGYTGQIILLENVLSEPLTKENVHQIEQISQQIIDLDPIYAIYTSGSTGNPKGVLISHKGVIDFIEWAITTYSITDTATIGNQVPFYFDVSTLDIYSMVVTGATLNIIPEDRFAFPIKLIEYVNEKKINTVCWVPSVLNNVSNFDAFSTLKPTSLNKILFAGEAMPNKHLNYWRKNYPSALYANLYGPTEITVICTYYTVDREFNDDEPLPIGKACKNAHVLIVSENGLLAKKGDLGELCVRGSSLAFGYYNDPEKTKLAFVQNPLHNLYPDLVYKTGDLVYENEYGEIMFVGRKDSQIKHMGYRIELGEIETAMLGVEGVKNACVLYDEYKKEIAAFFVAHKSNVEIRKDLINTLPKYMIPTIWIEKETFALNANGKINRLELKEQL